MTATAERPGRAPGAKGLRRGALGPAASTVIALASTAPAYSMAAGLGPLAGEVGSAGALVLLLAAVPIVLVAVAFRELNRVEPDCGASYTWVHRAFGWRAGFAAGWAVVVADVLVLTSLADVSGTYLLLVLDLPTPQWAITLAGLAWLGFATWLCCLGVLPTARLQVLLLAAEVVLLSLFVVGALVRGDRPLAAGWGLPGDASALVAGMLIAVFLYWGWDTALSLNEETRDPDRVPGQAVLLSMAALVVLYVAVAATAPLLADLSEFGDSDDVLAELAGPALGPVGGRLLLLAVLTSAVASTVTTILPTARTTLAMGVDRTIPPALARVSARYRTPVVSTVACGVLAGLLYVLLAAVSTDVLYDAVAATALLIAFYYGLTAFACAWWPVGRAGRPVLLRVVLPALGGLSMAALLVASVLDLTALPLVVAAAGMAVGLLVSRPPAEPAPRGPAG